MIWSMVLPGLVLLGVVIFVHELGHFLVAKWRGVRVLKFSLGFGRALVKWTRGETEYRLSWIPLGGYVQMAGDTPGEDGAMPDRKDEFLSHHWFGRLLIAAAGPAANLLTAFLVMCSIGLVGVGYPDFTNVLGPVADTTRAFELGLREGDRITAVGDRMVESWAPMIDAALETPERQPLELGIARGDSTFRVTLGRDEHEAALQGIRPPPDPPIVGNIVTGMPAYKAGLKEGDRILSVDGTSVRIWEELPALLQSSTDRPVRLTIDRGGRVFDVTVTPMSPDGKGGPHGGRIGIEAPRHGVYVKRYSVARSIQYGFFATGQIVTSVYGGLWLTFSRPLYYREYLGGPLFIAQAASEQARRGLDSYLQFLAMINVAIMAFNLLPIPVLDGGHIVLALLEAFRRQAISSRAYARFQKVGLAVIGTLFILILANDPLRLVQRHRALGKAPQEGQVVPSPP